MVSDGCVIGPGSRVENCVIGVRSRVGSRAVIRDTVIIGSDEFETPAERAENARRGRPDLNIGDDVVVERAILDKDCRVGKGSRLVNANGKTDADGPNGMYYIRDGIICVPRGAIIPDGTVI
jgi:glucose-1-phosphate adenylyltransferase